jgi:GNAT superfamily N-acetyltransferase
MAPTYLCDSQEKMQLTKTILADLPEWFGLPASTADYIEKSGQQTMIAVEKKGFLTLIKTSPSTGEIYVMGVLKAYHHQGIGKQLIQEALRWCQKEKLSFLQVKTLADTHPDKHYQRTRAFYQKMGFLPVEIFPNLWGPENPCLLMIQAVPTLENTRIPSLPMLK